MFLDTNVLIKQMKREKVEESFRSVNRNRGKTKKSGKTMVDRINSFKCL